MQNNQQQNKNTGQQIQYPLLNQNQINNNFQEQQISQNFNHYENDTGFGILQEKIQFLNYEDCQIKIVPVKDPQSQENALLHLTIFSEVTAYENLKYTCIINFEEEYQKQKNLDNIFDGLELKEVGTTFAEYFSQNRYTFVQDNLNDNNVKLQINTSMIYGKKEKTINIEFLFQKLIKQQQQNLEEYALSNMVKQNYLIQNKNKKTEQNLNLENLKTFILENLQSQNNEIDQNVANFSKENLNKTKEISKIFNQNQIFISLQLNNLEKEINIKFQKLNQEMSKLQLQNEFEQFQQLQQQNLEFIQSEFQNLKNNIENNFQEQTGLQNKIFQEILNEQTTFINFIKQKCIQNTQNITDYLNQYTNTNNYLPQQQQQLKQYFKNKDKNLYNIKNFINQNYTYSYKLLENISKEIFKLERQQLLETNYKLQNVIELFQDPRKILSLSIMLPKQFDAILNPKQILKFNIKDITVDQFKDKCANISNSLILTKVKETEISDWEIFGGYVLDSLIFEKVEGSCKTNIVDPLYLPFTFDLNQNVKRNLINKDKNCYFRRSDRYFEFSCDFFLNTNNSFSFNYSNKIYKSNFQQENQNQKQYKYYDIYDIQIEVIQLF